MAGRHFEFERLADVSIWKSLASLGARNSFLDSHRLIGPAHREPAPARQFVRKRFLAHASTLFGSYSALLPQKPAGGGPSSLPREGIDNLSIVDFPIG
jgi:hypothetical protein